MSNVIITGSYSTGNPQYNGLSRWKIKALNNLDDYAKYIGADLFVVDNSTGFHNYVQEIKQAAKNLDEKKSGIMPCNWCIGTLSSVWGVRNLLNKYNNYIWIDLDMITNINYNILEIANGDFCIFYHKQDCSNIEALDPCRKRKTVFCMEYLNQSMEDFYNLSSGIFKMSNDIVSRFDSFYKENINIDSLICHYKKYIENNYYKFMCDESVIQGFLNKNKELATRLDIDSFVVPFFLLNKYEKEQLVKNKTDKFIHFAGNDKKYIPEFLEKND